MEIKLEDLLNYIKIQESLEKLYLIYYDLDLHNKYIKRIIRYYIMQEYKKIIKKKKCKKKFSKENFLIKSNKYIKNLNNLIKEEEFKVMIYIDKFRKIIKSKYKPFFKKYKGGVFCSTDLYCLDCDIQIKNKMLNFHLQGKKHKRNKNKEIFYEILQPMSYIKKRTKKLILILTKKINPSLNGNQYKL